MKESDIEKYIKLFNNDFKCNFSKNRFSFLLSDMQKTLPAASCQKNPFVSIGSSRPVMPL